MALKLEYKEKSGKDYGAAPASDKEKEKKDAKKSTKKEKEVVAPVAPVTVKATPAPVSTSVRACV